MAETRKDPPEPIISHMLNCTCYLTARVGGSYCPQVRAFLDGVANADTFVDSLAGQTQESPDSGT